MNISESIKTYAKHLYKETNTYDNNDLTVRTTDAVKLASLLTQEPNDHKKIRTDAVKSMQRADSKEPLQKFAFLSSVF